MRLDQQIRSASALRLREIQEQLRSVSTFREIQTSISANALREIQTSISANALRDLRVNTSALQDLRVNTNALREIQTSISANALRDLRVNTSALQDLRVNTNALREIQTSISANALRDLRVNTNALRERQDRITTTAPFLEAIGNFRTIMDRVAAQNTAVIDQLGSVFHQDMQDRFSKLTSFSHNLHSFIEKHAEDLLKEKAISKQKMTDAVKKQTEDLFRELENEEVANEVESLERFWRKVVEGWGKIPDWSKNCLVMIIWSILQMHLSAHLDVLFQISHQAAGPTTIVHKPVTVIIKKAERQGFRLPSEYRIVTARILNVRERPKRHSDIRGKLLAGDLVLIQKKKKNWSLVEYSNPEKFIKSEKLA